MTTPGAGPWRGHLFGLDLEGHFPAPGLDQLRGRSSGRRSTLRRVPLAALDEWPTEQAGVLYERNLAGARFAIEWDEKLGFLLDHDHFGRFHVTIDGAAVACAPRDMPDWHWQRFLVGQVLPLTAMLQGLEPFHASAVEIDSQAVLCLGSSGAGKSSVALHLADRGAALVADDVVALEVCHREVLAHPSPALASIDADELDRFRPSGPVRDWLRLGSLDGEIRLAGPGDTKGPLSAGAMYALAHRREARVVSIRAIGDERPAVLLGATFNSYYRASRRVGRHLDLCGHLAMTVPLFRVDVPPERGAADVAEAIERHVLAAPHR